MGLGERDELINAPFGVPDETEKGRNVMEFCYARGLGLIDLEEAHYRVNREALGQVLRMHAVGGKLLSGIKSMYVDSLACVRG